MQMTCLYLGAILSKCLEALLKKVHFRTEFQTVLGRNLRKFPTDFGRNYVFGRNSDRKGVVRKDRVANNSSVPNSVPNIFQTDFVRFCLWDIRLKFGWISDGIKFNFLRISDGIKLKFPTQFGQNSVKTSYDFQTDLN